MGKSEDTTRHRFILFSTPFITVLCLFFSPLAATAAQSDPAEAVRMLQKAIDTRDATLMERHIDLDAVVGKAVDAVLTDADAVKEAERSSPAIALVLSGMGSDERVKSVARHLLTAETKQFVRYGVTSGAFAGTAKPGAHPGAGLLAANLRGGAGDKKTFGAASVRSQSADAALVNTSLTDAANGESYPLELGLQQQNGVWRVTEITNIHALIRRTVAGSGAKKAGGKK